MAKKKDDALVDELPPLCVDGAAPDLHAVFAKLRDMWVQVEDGRSYAALAKRLGSKVKAQNVSQWATGSGKKSPPPWHIIMTLCHDLGLRVVIDPSKIELHRQQAPAQAE